MEVLGKGRHVRHPCYGLIQGTVASSAVDRRPDVRYSRGLCAHIPELEVAGHV